MKPTTLIATAAALVVLPSTAFASTNTAENISICKAEIETQLANTVTDADLDFKTVKGNSRVQTLAFRIDADGEKGVEEEKEDGEAGEDQKVGFETCGG